MSRRFRHKKFAVDSDPADLDYKDLDLLKQFIGENRQDRAEPHHRRKRPFSAAPGEGNQARPLPGAVALYRPAQMRPAP